MTGELPLELILLVVGGLGHLALWVGINNRIHATGLSRRAVKRWSAVCYAALLGGALLYAALFIAAILRAVGVEMPSLFDSYRLAVDGAKTVWNGYWPLCCAVALIHFPQWAWRRATRTVPAALRTETAESVDVAELLGDWPVEGRQMQLARQIPGNQLVRFSITHKTLALGRLAPEHEGLSIVHLSDFHFSGRVTRRYFDVVVQRANALEPDLIVVTGDICDKSHCLDWIPGTLGQLKSRFGTFFVLGNHDLRVDSARLRALLTDQGLIDAAAGARLVDMRGRRLLIAGNERPWFASPLEKPASDDDTLRILLSHSPDQLPWARASGFDLMLAGHTHGGQICFPGIGPMVCPSRHGIRYASGVFHEPPTLLHVSRGISSLARVRINCQPEMSKLVLVRG
jgi:uncharacterized protein